MTPTNPPRPVIEVAGVRKTYHATVAVDDVSFAVYDGEIFGLIGPNGAGKTTTMECVQGLRTPDRGTISVLGLDPFRTTHLMEEAERRRDRVAIIDHGRIVDIDTPENFVRRHCPERTVALATDHPGAGARFRVLPRGCVPDGDRALHPGLSRAGGRGMGPRSVRVRDYERRVRGALAGARATRIVPDRGRWRGAAGEEDEGGTAPGRYGPPDGVPLSSRSVFPFQFPLAGRGLVLA